MTNIKDDTEAKRLFDKSFILEDNGNLTEALYIREKLVSYAPYEERFIIALARSYKNLSRLKEAEEIFRKSIILYPKSELSSLQLFHFLWGSGQKDEAFEEIKRFQSISHSDDYVEIVREINDKSSSLM